MKVLVIDDCVVIRERLATMMGEMPDVVVHVAGDADEGLRVARERQPDLVLLDLKMPGRNGLAVIAELKAVASRPRVVVLTADPTEPHRRLSVARGADFFFDKSGDLARVLETVLGLTANPSSSDTGSSPFPTSESATRRLRSPGGNS